jgi:flagellar hook-associated protein 3 FlgL
LQVDISEGVKTQYNKTAPDVLEFKDKNGNAINVSDLLSNIINNLGSTNQTQINQLTGQNLSDIQSVTANLLQKRSEVGTMQNRMDSAQTNNETQNANMTDILSKTEDIDFTEKTMEYSTMQTVYTAALQTSAKILPMTILSYL